MTSNIRRIIATDHAEPRLCRRQIGEPYIDTEVAKDVSFTARALDATGQTDFKWPV